MKLIPQDGIGERGIECCLIFELVGFRFLRLWLDFERFFDIATDAVYYIRSSEKFLSFYEEIIDAHLLFYIILSNHV